MTAPTKPGWYAILHEDRGNTLALLTQEPGQSLRMLLPGDSRLHDPATWTGEFVGPLDVLSIVQAEASLASVRAVLTRWLEYAELADVPEALRRDFAIELTAALGPPRTVGPVVPWWMLRLSLKDGPRAGRYLGNTTEFRAVLRGLLTWSLPSLGMIITSNLNSCYQFDPVSERALQEGRVDWRWFPMHESVFHTWKPPTAMRAEMQKDKKS